MKTKLLSLLLKSALSLAVAVLIGALVGTLMAPSPARAQATQTYNGYTVVPFTCRVTAVSATTECKALTAGSKAFVTDAIVSNNVGTAQTIKLTVGTGTNCGTGTADLTHAVQFGAAVGNFNLGPFLTPLQPAAAGLAVCVTPSAATSISATVNGFVTPFP